MLPPVPSSTTTMTAADIDNDGQDEVVLGGYGDGTGAGQLVALTGLGSSNLDTTPIPVNGLIFGLQRIDWNQDGADDLFLWEQPTATPATVAPRILQNRGGGLFEELAAGPSPSITARTSVVVPAIESPAAQACPPRLASPTRFNRASPSSARDVEGAW